MIKNRGTKLADESDWMELGDQLNVVLCKRASGLREAAPGCWVEEVQHGGGNMGHRCCSQYREMTSGL